MGFELCPNALRQRQSDSIESIGGFHFITSNTSKEHIIQAPKALSTVWKREFRINEMSGMCLSEKWSKEDCC